MRTSKCPYCYGQTFQNEVISILCPTRGRPNNVNTLVESAIATAEKPANLEFIFYVDIDDLTFPTSLLDKYQDRIKVMTGPRQWISNCHNALYTLAQGEILMTAGDDMEFKTKYWDTRVRGQFALLDDKIALVFGNDNATHAGKIAVHGFFHQHWVHCLGTWVQPGRGLPWDLWTTENARLLGRLFYLKDVVIAHNHYRQGSARAVFDQTYQDLYSQSSSFRPWTTYSLLERDRRIDRILLREAMDSMPPLEKKYLLAEIIIRVLGARVNSRRVLSMSNSEILRTSISYPQRMLKKMLKKV
jgi:hypothetical protein